MTEKLRFCGFLYVLSAAWQRIVRREIFSKPEVKGVDTHVPELGAIYCCFISKTGRPTFEKIGSGAC